MTFAQKLRELREAKGLSEVKLAAASGVSLGTVRVYGLGQRSPSFANVLALAKALGASANPGLHCSGLHGANRWGWLFCLCRSWYSRSRR